MKCEQISQNIDIITQSLHIIRSKIRSKYKFVANIQTQRQLRFRKENISPPKQICRSFGVVGFVCICALTPMQIEHPDLVHPFPLSFHFYLGLSRRVFSSSVHFSLSQCFSFSCVSIFGSNSEFRSKKSISLENFSQFHS